MAEQQQDKEHDRQWGSFDPGRPDLVKAKQQGRETPPLRVTTEKQPEDGPDTDERAQDRTAAAIDPVITSNPD